MNFFDTGSIPDSEPDHDVVECDIAIDAPLENVWALISEAGWWMNDGPMDDHEVTVDEDGIYHVADPEAGEWLFEKVDEDPMDVVAYRWFPLAGDELPEDRATRVEFSLSEEDGQTVLHVEESGFTSVSDDEDEALVAWEQAHGMWEEVFAATKKYLES